MSMTASDNTRFERLIAEAFAAQKAGVFARTPVDVAALAAPAPAVRKVRWHERVLVGLPVAACVAAVLGIASMWAMTGGDGSMTSPLASVRPSIGGEQFSAQMLVECMTGPGEAVSNGCTAADLDGDGHVDLRDLSAFQVLAAGRR
jgi:hypothetical protein